MDGEPNATKMLTKRIALAGQRETLIRFLVAAALLIATVAWLVPSLAAPPAGACALGEGTPTSLFCGDTQLLATAAPGDDGKALRAKFAKGAMVVCAKPTKATDTAQGSCASLADVRFAKSVGGAPAFLPGILALGAALIFVVLAVGAQFHALKFYLLGDDGRLSNSKVQLAVAGGTTLVAILAHTFARMLAGMPLDVAASVVVPDSLSTILASSVAVAGVAKIAAAGNTAAPKIEWHLSDLFRQDDGETFNVADTQMFVLTTATIVIFAWQVVSSLGAGMDLTASAKLPEPTAALALLFGGSLAAYISPKLSDLAARLKPK